MRRRRELALVFALIFGAGSGGSRLAAVEVPFTARAPISTAATTARSVFAADIDGDGDLDTLSASGGNDTIAWHENASGNGSSWTEEIVATDADFAQSVFAADIDGDGDLDVLSASSVDDAIVWYDNTGAGPGWNATTISSAADAALSVFAADVDGDGDVDVLSASNIDDKIAWYENEIGDGTSWTPHTIAIGTSATGTDGASGVFAADLDGDGDLDLASASFLHDKIAWHKNVNGDGTSWTTHSVDTTADGARSVFAADVDSDGDQDLLSASVGDDSVVWHENLGGLGASWSSQTIATVDEARSVFAADVDGDGDVDAVSASLVDDEVAWHENLAGDGSSWTARALTTTADKAYSVFAGDVDGDGDLDVLSASADDNEIAWFENRTIHRSALLEEEIVVATTADSPYSLFAADVDGDGDVDALSASKNDNQIAWYENELGDGSSWTSRTITSTAPGTRSVSAADVDGDGDTDALAVGSSGPTAGLDLAWYENDLGNGTVWTPRVVETALEGADSVVAADLDGDGDLDVLAAAGDDDEVGWWQNAGGAGTSWTAHTVATGVDEARSAIAADVDGDGDLDALAVSLADDTVYWFENSMGDGTSWARHTVVIGPAGPGSVFAGDVDGDGDLDVLAASAVDDRIWWFENVQDGASWVNRTIASTANAATSVFAADLDGDGDLDALSSSSSDDEVAWYENGNGDGTSWAARTIATAADQARSVLAADVDGDGDLDALAASSNDDTIAWYPNRGGQFALPTTALAQGVLADSQEDVALQIDLEHRGRPDDHDVELETLELRLENGSGAALTTTQANNLIDKLELFLDDGSGSFEFPADTLVEAVTTFALVAGVQSIDLAVGDPDVQVAFGESKRYFVVVTMTSNAASQTPDSFELFHSTEASSAARDASAPTVPLRLEFHPDTSTELVDTDLTASSCKAPFDLDLEGFLVTTAVVCEAGTVLTAGDGLKVSATGDLTLRAGQRVRFATDFSVQSGGGLTTQVDPSLEP